MRLEGGISNYQLEFRSSNGGGISGISSGGRYRIWKLRFARVLLPFSGELLPLLEGGNSSFAPLLVSKLRKSRLARPSRPSNERVLIVTMNEPSANCNHERMSWMAARRSEWASVNCNLLATIITSIMSLRVLILTAATIHCIHRPPHNNKALRYITLWTWYENRNLNEVGNMNLVRKYFVYSPIRTYLHPEVKGKWSSIKCGVWMLSISRFHK